MSCWANFTVLSPASKICSSDGDGDTSSAAHERLPSSFIALAVGLPLVSALSTTNITYSSIFSTGFVGLGLLLFIFFSFWPGRTSASTSSEA
jgi:hypothetical protein